MDIKVNSCGPGVHKELVGADKEMDRKNERDLLPTPRSLERIALRAGPLNEMKSFFINEGLLNSLGPGMSWH